MPEEYKWDHLHYDRRFKMKQVTGLTHQYSYGIESVSGETEGYYNNSRGGFLSRIFINYMITLMKYYHKEQNVDGQLRVCLNLMLSV